MRLPVGRVLAGQVLVADHEQVLGVVLLCGLGEVEAAGNDRLVVDDHDLVVCFGVLGVDPHGDSQVDEQVRRGILLRPLALVENHLNFDPPLVGIDQGFRDRGRRKRVGLHQDRRPGRGKFLDHRFRASTTGVEVDFDRRQRLCGRDVGYLGRGLLAAGEAEKYE